MRLHVLILALVVLACSTAAIFSDRDCSDVPGPSEYTVDHVAVGDPPEAQRHLHGLVSRGAFEDFYEVNRFGHTVVAIQTIGGKYQHRIAYVSGDSLWLSGRVILSVGDPSERVEEVLDWAQPPLQWYSYGASGDAYLQLECPGSGEIWLGLARDISSPGTPLTAVALGHGVPWPWYSRHIPARPDGHGVALPSSNP